VAAARVDADDRVAGPVEHEEGRVFGVFVVADGVGVAEPELSGSVAPPAADLARERTLE
jgi:hypothetical protein